MVEYTIAHFAKNQEMHRVIPASELLVNSTLTKFFSAPSNSSTYGVPKTMTSTTFSAPSLNNANNVATDSISGLVNVPSISLRLRKSIKRRRKSITDALAPLSHIAFGNGSNSTPKKSSLRSVEPNVHTIIHQYPVAFHKDLDIYGIF